MIQPQANLIGGETEAIEAPWIGQGQIGGVIVSIARRRQLRHPGLKVGGGGRYGYRAVGPIDHRLIAIIV